MKNSGKLILIKQHHGNFKLVELEIFNLQTCSNKFGKPSRIKMKKTQKPEGKVSGRR